MLPAVETAEAAGLAVCTVLEGKRGFFPGDLLFFFPGDLLHITSR